MSDQPEEWMKCLTCMSFDPDDETCDHLMRDVDPDDYCDDFDPGEEQEDSDEE